jgi:hypothetical protein
VTAVLTWASADSTVLKIIDPVKGIGVVLRKLRGNEWVYVYVMAEQIDQAAHTWYDTRYGPDSLKVNVGIDFIAHGEEVQICEYLLYKGQAVRQSVGTPGLHPCPILAMPTHLDRQQDVSPAAFRAVMANRRYYQPFGFFRDIRIADR